MPSFLPKMRRAACPLRCTTLPSAIFFQGSAGSSKARNSFFLKPDSAAVHVFIHTARIRSLGSSDCSFGSVCGVADMGPVTRPPLLLGSMVAGILVENGGARAPCAGTAFRLRPGGRRLHDSARSYVHPSSFLSASVAAVSRHQLLGHRCQLLVGLAHRGEFRILPETTAIWGLLPGAAPAMMVMADAYGADARLVAFIPNMSCSHGRSRSFHYCPFSGFTHRRLRPQRLRSGLRRSAHCLLLKRWASFLAGSLWGLFPAFRREYC